MKLMNENRCHIENIKGLENHQGIIREHLIGREKMIIIFIQENKIKKYRQSKSTRKSGKIGWRGQNCHTKKIVGEDCSHLENFLLKAGGRF